MNFKEKIAISAIILSAVFFIAPKIVLAQVIINEVAWMGTKASSADEWIELYNNSNESISIEGWSLNEGGDRLIIALKNSIAANSYYLIERTDENTTSITADLFGSWGGNGLSNDGEKISLKDSDGNIIDEVDCSLGWFAGKASPDYQTMERTDPGLPPTEANWHNNSKTSASTDNEGNLIQGTPKAQNSVAIAPTPSPSASPSPVSSPSPTPSTSNSPTPTPSNETISSPPPSPSPTPAAPNYQYSQKVFINEFMPWPEDGGKEWIELINSGISTINLSGWQIDDSNNSTAAQMISDNANIAPGGFLVISLNKNILNNDGDKVRLLWPDSQVVHAIAYETAKQGQSVAKFDTGWLWTNQPTPGETNKKSIAENTAAAPSATIAGPGGITPTEENVNATTPPAPDVKTTPASTVAPPTAANPGQTNAGQTQNNTTQPNLLAAADAPIPTSKTNSVLALAGVLLSAALAASGLVYFRRRLSKTVDDSRVDD